MPSRLRFPTLLSSLRSAGVLTAVLVASAFTTLGSAPSGPQDFTLHNSIGSTIMEVYVSPSTEDDWEEDVLGEDVLPHGESVDITFDRPASEADWDLKVVNEAGRSFVWKKLDLTTISEVTISIRNGQTYATTR